MKFQNGSVPEAALTIISGSQIVLYKTEGDVIDAMLELYATDFNKLNRNPITDYLRTLSYDNIRTLLSDGPVVIEVAAGKNTIHLQKPSVTQVN